MINLFVIFVTDIIPFIYHSDQNDLVFLYSRVADHILPFKMSENGFCENIRNSAETKRVLQSANVIADAREKLSMNSNK